MVSRLFSALALIGLPTLAACGDGGRAVGDETVVKESTVVADRDAGASPGFTSLSPGEGWDLQSSGDGVTLVYAASDVNSIRLFCPAGRERILINVPSFRPIASEERLTFGGGNAAEVLVADARGDQKHGGISAAGPVPSDLEKLLDGPVSASYGAQRTGPHPAPPDALAREFRAACSRTTPGPTPSPRAGEVSACLIQDGDRLSVAPLRGLGTEPFWAVQVDGRCVTYSHPDNQQGTRVWTRYTAGPKGGTWSGALDGRPFILRTRAQPGCLDGMSDRRYPFALDLSIGGKQLSGCAGPR